MWLTGVEIDDLILNHKPHHCTLNFLQIFVALFLASSKLGNGDIFKDETRCLVTLELLMYFAFALWL